MLTINRIRDTGVLTMGRMSYWENEVRTFQCVSLEPSWVLNEPFISCIPVGEYPCKKRTSDKFGNHIHVQNVEGRSYILIHTLNYFKQTEGCIGVGSRFKYVNEDDVVDITESRPTLDSLLDILPDQFSLKISEHVNFQTFYNERKGRF